MQEKFLNNIFLEFNNDNFFNVSDTDIYSPAASEEEEKKLIQF